MGVLMLEEQLRRKVLALNELMWEGRVIWPDIQRWIANFAGERREDEHLHALFLLSHFSYFNSRMMRVLLGALYRDLIQYPIIAKLRRDNANTLDIGLIDSLYRAELKRMRFVGLGNPSESGNHLLYYFRQENALSPKSFVHPHELYDSRSNGIQLVAALSRVVFLDDFCGSGRQVRRFTRNIIPRIRADNPTIRLSYHPLFATSAGLQRVRDVGVFDEVEALCELDESFRALSPSSRYFLENHEGVSRDFAIAMCEKYGQSIEPSAPMGFRDCQLLVGFAHNVPNNTLPIFWSEGNDAHPWTPVFARHRKGAQW
jgi:hypothetical protein